MSDQSAANVVVGTLAKIFGFIVGASFVPFAFGLAIGGGAVAVLIALMVLAALSAWLGMRFFGGVVVGGVVCTAAALILGLWAVA